LARTFNEGQKGPQEISMHKSFKLAVAAGLAIMSLATPGRAQEFNAQQKQEIEQIIRSYLLENPEILAEAQQAYELKQKAAEDQKRVVVLKAMTADVFKLPGDPVLGALNGDVTVVEFFDYNCGWCKRSISELAQLIEKDKNVRVVFKELPIFGEGSEYAARAALASVKQNKYWELHQALFAAEQQVTPEVVDATATAVGLNLEQLKRDMDDPAINENLVKNQNLAQSLLINGTPAFIIDETVVPGYVPLAKLEETIAGIRSSGGCKLC
jgi:protein-disulfide isomerase